MTTSCTTANHPTPSARGLERPYEMALPRIRKRSARMTLAQIIARLHENRWHAEIRKAAQK